MWRSTRTLSTSWCTTRATLARFPATDPGVNIDPFGAVIKAALIAGVVAGLLVATVQFVWTEPIVDRAIVLEEQLHGADRSHAETEQAAPVEIGRASCRERV